MARHLLGEMREKINRKVSALTTKTLFRDKLNNWLGYLSIAALACIFGLLISRDLMSGLSFFVAIVGFVALVIFLKEPEVCFYFFLFFAFLIYWFNSAFFHGDFPVGLVYDILAIVMLLGLSVSRPDFRISIKYFNKIPLVTYFFVILFFNVVEMFNPNSGGASATNITGFRKFLDFIIILFAAYNLFDSMEKIRKFSNMLLIAAGISAIYGCIQQWFGLMPWELESILSNPIAFGLLFVNGEFRKFGTMSDPSIYGLLMTGCTLYYFILGIYEKDKKWRAAYIIGAIFMLLAVGYSGTRTAYATMLAGLGFFILLNIDKPAIQKLGIASVIGFLILMYGPLQSIGTVRRFRSTFIGTQDQSYKVRLEARAFIQPYVRSHPIGGGLGTTGFNGAKEHPGHPLANFQPDGSYVVKATETGWVGLILVCILYFMVMRTGIRGFFKARSPDVKVYYGACLSAIFSFYVGEYTQLAVGGVTDSLVYFPLIAIMLNLKYFDTDAEPRHPEIGI